MCGFVTLSTFDAIRLQFLSSIIRTPGASGISAVRLRVHTRRSTVRVDSRAQYPGRNAQSMCARVCVCARIDTRTYARYVKHRMRNIYQDPPQMFGSLRATRVFSARDLPRTMANSN